MVKYKVNKVFQDIHTKEIYTVGQEIDIAVKRAKEIESNLDSTYIERVEEAKAKVGD